ncbi:Glycosyl hydrolases family 39 [Izhakiella capsodis]|uniref:Glycosyl hydrolases family 39 n=1 Tax=Izhakiella capsodis TaxID=1367852 RepID=A0A1I4X494_9GAMM|nr:glycoside hydrolase family 39 [Izhakiella capsodis]SFN20303.1 Glycosyl hydrolases family 39 [Izhakiella capsodis]
MSYFSVNINKSERDYYAGHGGLLKEVNGVNGIPVSVAPGFPDLEDQFNQMGITYIRLHDGLGIGDLDNYFEINRKNNQNQFIPNVPRSQRNRAKKFVADMGNCRVIFPYAAAGMRSNNVDLAFRNVNYGMTDAYIRRILNNNPYLNPGNIERQLMFRIGRTLDGGYEVPQNVDIYATLVSTLVNRYSLNYAQTGLPRKVKYWEIWNEPDLTFFWNNNNPQVYYNFYRKVARMIKAVDPDAKVGGAGVAAGYNPGGAYIDGLLRYCRETDTPIDFISWHYYANNTSDPQNVIDVGNSVQQAMIRYGYSDIESICTEWNSSPVATINTFTKVQSAKNAAYIASTFCYMQYCKVDKAFYYRGDGLPFGLFNDNPNPVNTSFKSFCTYSAQAFNLFTRMFETPFILQQDNNFGTGITTLACENSTGTKINILVANYKVNKDFSNGDSAPSDTSLYRQHYIDSNRTLDQLDDDWSINEWFGGIRPNTIQTDNEVQQNNVVSQIPPSGVVVAKRRNYLSSDSGVDIRIENVDFFQAKITAYRIKEGGDLSSISPPTFRRERIKNVNDGLLRFIDPGATASTVSLYSIEFF